ncbi:hypothetical protein DSB67_21010 [Vibrio campbellii]|uniref:hypothetical protein n=1 Tax=Vibrio campbellii TaxID=680 RepID=UPI00026C52F9|nr:hypothetical protein [Vibrio campbellii]AXB33879.1 hypothetical protein DSB67_21010 [Vibrio campbellii]
MSELWKNLVVATVSFLLAIVGQQYFFGKQTEIPKIDVHTNFDSNYMSKPKFPDTKVEIKVNDKAKESIGLFEISLVNFSDKAFKDIPIIIEVKPKKGESFIHLSHFAHGEKEMKELVKETKPYELENGSYRFSYNAVSINRTEKSEVAMRLGILFEGQSEPDVVVSGPGFNTRVFDIENSPARSEMQKNTVLLFIAILLGMVAFTLMIFGPVISLLSSPIDRKSDKRYAKQIFDVLRSGDVYDQMSDDELKSHVADFLYRRQINWWDTKSTLGKWFLGMREPKTSDYRIE